MLETQESLFDPETSFRSEFMNVDQLIAYMFSTSSVEAASTIEDDDLLRVVQDLNLSPPMGISRLKLIRMIKASASAREAVEDLVDPASRITTSPTSPTSPFRTAPWSTSPLSTTPWSTSPFGDSRWKSPASPASSTASPASPLGHLRRRLDFSQVEDEDEDVPESESARVYRETPGTHAEKAAAAASALAAQKAAAARASGGTAITPVAVVAPTASSTPLEEGEEIVAESETAAAFRLARGTPQQKAAAILTRRAMQGKTTPDTPPSPITPKSSAVTPFPKTPQTGSIYHTPAYSPYFTPPTGTPSSFYKSPQTGSTYHTPTYSPHFTRPTSVVAQGSDENVQSTVTSRVFHLTPGSNRDKAYSVRRFLAMSPSAQARHLAYLERQASMMRKLRYTSIYDVRRGEREQEESRIYGRRRSKMGRAQSPWSPSRRTRESILAEENRRLGL